jgi:hypothetical protein
MTRQPCVFFEQKDGVCTGTGRLATGREYTELGTAFYKGSTPAGIESTANCINLAYLVKRYSI